MLMSCWGRDVAVDLGSNQKIQNYRQSRGCRPNDRSGRYPVSRLPAISYFAEDRDKDEGGLRNYLPCV